MEIWIEVDENKRITGYSETEVEGFVKTSVRSNQLDNLLYQYKYENETVTKDLAGWQAIVEAQQTEKELSEIERLQQENVELKNRVEQAESSILEIADLVIGGL